MQSENTAVIEPVRPIMVENKHSEPIGGPMHPDRFLELVNRCLHRKIWGFCNRCQIGVRTEETDGQTTEGILDKTIFHSIQLEGHIPFNTRYVRSVEFLAPHTLGQCVQ